MSELLIINRGGRRKKRRRSRKARRHIKTMSCRALTVRFKGKSRTWRGLSRLLGPSKAAKLWRARKKFGGWKRRKHRAKRHWPSLLAGL